MANARRVIFSCRDQYRSKPLFKMSAKPHCRLFVILAREADVGVILRRGPSKWVQIIKWDTRQDKFEDGAWFHGRIYEDSCDLSPDGELFVYFAAKHDRHRQVDGYGYAWTAVSRPPWLYALALWPSPCGAWPGGGRFSDNLCLNLLTATFDLVSHPKHPSPPQLVVRHRNWSDFEYSRKNEIDEVDWSGRDQRHHIVYSREGKLFRRVNCKDHQLDRFPMTTSRPRCLAPAWARL